MLQYDEDLQQNTFFKLLQTKATTLYDKAIASRWIICVPRASSLSTHGLSENDFENHILIPSSDDDKFSTTNNKVVSVEGSILTTETGFSETRSIPILFEETFFNKNEESYRVLCMNQPLEGGESTVKQVPERPVYHFTIKSLQDCADLLWGNTGNPKTKKLLDDIIDSFHKMLGQSLYTEADQLKKTTLDVFKKALQVVLKDSYMKRSSRNNPGLLTNVKLALETYIMHSVDKRLFRAICTCLAEKDAASNKITRNLTSLQLRDLGVRIEYCQNVPRARSELCNLSRHSTPLGKLNCLKKVVSALMLPTQASMTEGPMPLTSDDLLPMLVFLVVKADLPNWWAHFAHMTTFRYYQPSLDDEYGFYLATLEAALVHVSSGTLCDLELDGAPPQGLDHIESPSDNSLWKKHGSDTEAVDTFFQYVWHNDQAAVVELLKKGTRRSRSSIGSPSSSPDGVEGRAGLTPGMTPGLCHPLCDCPSCSNLMAAGRSTTPLNRVSVHSRNSRGSTALHIAVESGRGAMSDVLLRMGALVSGSDYLGKTPLHIACVKGHQNVTLLLLDHGALVNARDLEQNTPLHLACVGGHDDCVKAIVFFDQGSNALDINAANDFGDTPLHIAAKWGYYNIVELLLDNKASALARNRKNHPPAFYSHNRIIAQRLEAAATKQATFPVNTNTAKGKAKVKARVRHVGVEEGAAPNDQFVASTSGSDPGGGHPRGSEPLPAGVPANGVPARESQSRPGLSVADVVHLDESGSTSGRRSSVASADDLLSDSDAHDSLLTLDRRESVKDGPLTFDRRESVKDGSFTFVRRESVKDSPLTFDRRGSVKAASATVIKIDKLLRAVADGDEHMCKFHLGWESESEDESNDLDLSVHELCHPLCQCHKCLPLQKFTSSVSPDAVHVNSCDDQGFTPTHVATLNGHVTLLHLFLKHGASVNARTRVKNSTALHMACKQLKLQVVRVLLEFGADVKARDSQGNTPLHYCCMTGNEAKARLLIQHGCPLDIVNTRGNTPLHDAVKWNFLGVARLLLSVSASRHSRNAEGQLPRDLAQTEDMSRLLREPTPQRASPARAKSGSLESSAAP